MAAGTYQYAASDLGVLINSTPRLRVMPDEVFAFQPETAQEQVTPADGSVNRILAENLATSFEVNVMFSILARLRTTALMPTDS